MSATPPLQLEAAAPTVEMAAEKAHRDDEVERRAHEERASETSVMAALLLDTERCVAGLGEDPVIPVCSVG